jgi:multicomponent Na+:H+ antiporter subunit F
VAGDLLSGFDGPQTAAGAMLALAAALTLVRLVRGPGMLDRSIALDVLTACVLAVVTLAASDRRGYLLPMLLLLSLVGFTGSVAIARFAAGDDSGDDGARGTAPGPGPRPGDEEGAGPAPPDPGPPGDRPPDRGGAP